MEEKEFYKYKINKQEYLFDQEKFYNWNELTNELHLIRYTSGATNLNFLISQNGEYFLDFSDGDGFSNFLVNSGVQLISLEFDSYKVKRSDQIVFLENGLGVSARLFIDSVGETNFELCLEKDRVEIFRSYISWKQARKINFNRTHKKHVKFIMKEVATSIPEYKKEDTIDYLWLIGILFAIALLIFSLF